MQWEKVRLEKVEEKSGVENIVSNIVDNSVVDNSVLQVERRDKKSRLISLLRELGGSKTLVFLR